MPPVKKPQRQRQPNFFQKWREKANLTQSDVQERLGWSQSKVSRLESGESPYDQDSLEMLAELYGCLTAELLLVDPFDENAFYTLLAKATRASQPVQDQIASYLKFTLRDI